MITVKGLQLLKEVDLIYYPGSLLSDGTTSSFSYSILEYHQLEKEKLKGMFLSMSDNREDAEKTYAATFQKILVDYNNGLKVAIVSEGDISFYSTFAYLLKHIQKHQLNLEIIAGVPSFILGAALHQQPLAILNERIAILPRMKDIENLKRYLDEFETVVLIKVRSVMPALKGLLETLPINMVYCERLGTAQQFITTNLEDLANRAIPYFSLLILKKT